MAKLIYNEKVILENMKFATSTKDISLGLMFSTKKKARKGLCMVMPSDKDVRYGASITMLFVFFSLEILFINSEMRVVDKVLLKPWMPSYTPREECRYVIESVKGKFKEINIGDKVSIVK